MKVKAMNECKSINGSFVALESPGNNEVNKCGFDGYLMASRGKITGHEMQNATSTRTAHLVPFEPAVSRRFPVKRVIRICQNTILRKTEKTADWRQRNGKN